MGHMIIIIISVKYDSSSLMIHITISRGITNLEMLLGQLSPTLMLCVLQKRECLEMDQEQQRAF